MLARKTKSNKRHNVYCGLNVFESFCNKLSTEIAYDQGKCYGEVLKMVDYDLVYCDSVLCVFCQLQFKRIQFILKVYYLFLFSIGYINHNLDFVVNRNSMHLLSPCMCSESFVWICFYVNFIIKLTAFGSNSPLFLNSPYKTKGTEPGS